MENLAHTKIREQCQPHWQPLALGIMDPLRLEERRIGLIVFPKVSNQTNLIELGMNASENFRVRMIS
jgi:hypothetical protein